MNDHKYKFFYSGKIYNRIYFFLKCSIVNIFLIAVALSVCKSNL